MLAEHAGGPRESIAYHCQQYVEKLLKAFLTMHSVEAPRTHDIRRLVQLAVPAAPELVELEGSADLLTEYAVAMRYPDEWRELDEEEARKAVAVAKTFADALLPKIA